MMCTERSQTCNVSLRIHTYFRDCTPVQCGFGASVTPLVTMHSICYVLLVRHQSKIWFKLSRLAICSLLRHSI